MNSDQVKEAAKEAHWRGRHEAFGELLNLIESDDYNLGMVTAYAKRSRDLAAAEMAKHAE